MNMKLMERLILLTCLLLAACGGGGGTASSGSTEGPTAQASAEGVWKGTYSTSGSQFPSTALVTSNGRIGIDFGNGVLFIGTASTSDKLQFVGHESVSTPPLVTIGSTVTPQQVLSLVVLSGAYAVRTGDTLALLFDPVYTRGSSLAKLVGTWSGQDIWDLWQNWTISISSNGAFTGSFGDTSLSGNISLIDSSKNEYQVNVTVMNPASNYTLNGNYTGIAALLDNNGIDNSLLMFLEGDQQNKVLDKVSLQKN